MLDKLQIRVCRTAGWILGASLETLGHRWNVISFSLFYKYYFGRCSSELAELVPLPCSCGRYTRYSDNLHNFSSPFLDVKGFPRTARLWNYLNFLWFRINRHLLCFGSFYTSFAYAFNPNLKNPKKQPVCKKNSFIRYCCLSYDPWYEGLQLPQSFRSPYIFSEL